MPLTDEQKAALTLLAGAAVDDVAEALQNDANAIYNKVFGAGVKTGKQQVQTKLDTLTAELETAKTEATTLQTQLEELKDKAPDRAQIDSQWQARLDKEVRKVTDQLEAATAKVARLTTDTKVEKVENALLAAGFRPKMAKLLATSKAGLIDFDDNGQPILKDGDTPVQIPADKTAFQVLAEQEKAAADPVDLTSNVDTAGGGVTGGGTGGGTYDPAKAGKEMADKQKASAGSDSLAFR